MLERAGFMRSVKILQRKGKYVIAIEADGHKREYVEDSLEVAKSRASKIKQLLSIK